MAGGRPPKDARHIRGRGNGEQRRYLEQVVLSHVGDDCLMWPYSLLNSGTKPQYLIAKDYGVTAGHVSNIMNGKKAWEWLNGWG